MSFGANKTPIKVTTAEAFGARYFRDVYSGVNEKWHSKTMKELMT